MFEGTPKTRFRNLAATLHFVSLDRSDMQYVQGSVHKDGEADTRKWKRLKRPCRYLR